MLMNCGDGRLPRPSIGSWVTYGLGSENQNLPGFIAMCPGGYPIVATQNWRVGLPARRLPGHLHRHPAHRHREADREHPEPLRLPPAEQRRQLDLVQRLNERHLGSPAARRRSSRPASSRSSWPTACRPRRPTPSTSAASRKSIRELYGPGAARPAAADHPPAARARRPLRAGLARRRPAVGQPRRPRKAATASWPASATRPIAAFLTDLKQRGLLDSTLVIWGGEFGRTPVGRAAGS